ncbi:MAG TPA: FkbM family methyltransferase [Acidimicrobiales bacterium]|nr:FkbM family methyltransferase [Acidimicrobiales bacterium]
MPDATVALKVPGDTLALTGDAADAGVLGAVQRSGGAYEPGLLALLARRLAPDAVALDVGANIGPVTLAMSRLCPRGRVFALEPAPSNYAYLRANLAANRAGNVSAECLALYDTEGRLSFAESADDPAGSHVGEGSTSVDATTLDCFVAERGIARIDLVKMDVEGSELRVLRGGQATLTRLRPDLVFEVNPVVLRRFHRASYADLLDAVRATHPHVFSFDGHGRTAAVGSTGHVRRLLAAQGVVNLLATARRPGAGDLARGAGGLAALAARSNRWRAPALEFAVAPALRLSVPRRVWGGRVGERLHLPVGVWNTGREWLSSGWPHHPVHVACRWSDGAEGPRADLPRPLRPGAAGTAVLGVDLPARPGHYELTVTLVQERYAWFDDLDAALVARVAVEVHE